jgi:hypothetical protein
VKLRNTLVHWVLVIAFVAGVFVYAAKPVNAGDIMPGPRGRTAPVSDIMPGPRMR